MDKTKGTALLLHTEEPRAVGGVRGFVDTGGELVLENLNNVVEDAIGDRDVLVDPRDVLDGWDFDRREIVVVKPTLLLLSPREAEFVDLEDML